MKPANDYGAIMRNHAAGILAQVFSSEWSALPDDARELVIIDYLDAVKFEDIYAREYARRIGSGNLASYGYVMLARANSSRPWDGEVQS